MLIFHFYYEFDKLHHPDKRWAAHSIISSDDEGHNRKLKIFAQNGIRVCVAKFHPNGRLSEMMRFDENGDLHDPEPFRQAIETFNEEGTRTGGRSFTHGVEKFPEPPKLNINTAVVSDERSRPPPELPAGFLELKI